MNDDEIRTLSEINLAAMMTSEAMTAYRILERALCTCGDGTDEGDPGLCTCGWDKA